METGIHTWYPRIYVGNSVKTQNIVSFGNENALTSLWYNVPIHKMRYSGAKNKPYKRKDKF